MYELLMPLWIFSCIGLAAYVLFEKENKRKHANRFKDGFKTWRSYK